MKLTTKYTNHTKGLPRGFVCFVYFVVSFPSDSVGDRLCIVAS